MKYQHLTIAMVLEWRLTNFFFIKWQTLNILGLEGHKVPITTANSTVIGATINDTEMNEHGFVPIKLYLCSSFNFMRLSYVIIYKCKNVS